MPDGQAAAGSLIVTARFTLLAKPLMEVMVTVVLPVELGLMGTVFGARLMAKSGVLAGGTTVTVILRVWVMAPLVPDIVSRYLPSLAPAGTVMAKVAVVGVAMLGMTVDDGVMLAVAPAIALSPETLRVTADWKLPRGSILVVIVPEPPLGMSTFCGLAYSTKVLIAEGMSPKGLSMVVLLVAPVTLTG